MKFQKLTGLIAAPHTPFHQDGSLNLDVVPKQADWLSNNGVIGAFICGTTGEGASMTVQERLAVAERWVASAPADLKVIVHAGHNSLGEACTIAAHAQKIGAYAIAAIAPDFFRPASVNDLAEFCARIAEAAPKLPFYFYHMPAMTGVNFAVIDFLKAAGPRIPNLAGIKFTHENLMDYRQCLEFENGRYDMLFGRDEILISALALGAQGAVGSTYNFAAPIYLKAIDAFRKGDLETARAFQSKAIEMIAALGRFGGLAAGKAVMKMHGIDCGPVRLPMKSPSAEACAALRRELSQWIDFSNATSKHEAATTSRRASPIRVAVASALIGAATLSAIGSDALKWEKLPPLPDALGVAGAFAGTSGGALIVGGGANFPNGMPWEGGIKKWHDEVYVLAKPDGQWQSGFRLPKPNAYGVSVTTAKGVVCAGGGNAQDHFSDAFLLKWDGHKIETETLPPMPLPNAFAAGAVVDGVVYVAGGLKTPTSTETLRVFWALDLKKKNPKWEQLEPWPGPSRMLAAAAAHDSSFFLLSGTDLKPEASDKAKRVYLNDAYRYTPGKGWKRLADLPHPAVAAPSPAPVSKGRLLVISGDDGTLIAFEPKAKHPGFRHNVLCYDIRKDAWIEGEDCPLSCATAPTVEWHNKFTVVSGEVKPGRRSPDIWAVSLK